MTRNEVRQQVKNEALNKIVKAYGMNGSKEFFDSYDPDGYREQRDLHVVGIIMDLRRELKNM